MLKQLLAAVLLTCTLCVTAAVGASAATSPNGPGQPGAPATTCGSPNTIMTPGNASVATGSPFNSAGTAGGHYAGNPDTASLAHANSTHAVSQYDIACFQQTSNH
jgi:hypothetical protein